MKMNSNTYNKTGARPTYSMGHMTRGAGMKNLMRAEPRIGTAFGQNTQLYHRMRGNAGKAKRMGIIGY